MEATQRLPYVRDYDLDAAKYRATLLTLDKQLVQLAKQKGIDVLEVA